MKKTVKRKVRRRQGSPKIRDEEDNSKNWCKKESKKGRETAEQDKTEKRLA
jgi:hypothetical protein